MSGRRCRFGFLARFHIGRRGCSWAAVFRLKPAQDHGLRRAQLFSRTDLIERDVVPPVYLLAEGSLYIRESELWIAIARPLRCVLQEFEAVLIAGEPGLIKAVDIVVSIMQCTA